MAQKRKFLGKLAAVVSKDLESVVAGKNTIILLRLPPDATFKEVDEGELYDLMLGAPKIINVTFHYYLHQEEALKIKVIK